MCLRETTEGGAGSAGFISTSWPMVEIDATVIQYTAPAIAKQKAQVAKQQTDEELNMQRLEDDDEHNTRLRTSIRCRVCVLLKQQDSGPWYQP